jgi:hypothetical protein
MAATSLKYDGATQAFREDVTLATCLASLRFRRVRAIDSLQKSANFPIGGVT